MCYVYSRRWVQTICLCELIEWNKLYWKERQRIGHLMPFSIVTISFLTILPVTFLKMDNNTYRLSSWIIVSFNRIGVRWVTDSVVLAQISGLPPFHLPLDRNVIAMLCSIQLHHCVIQSSYPTLPTPCPMKASVMNGGFCVIIFIRRLRLYYLLMAMLCNT